MLQGKSLGLRYGLQSVASLRHLRYLSEHGARQELVAFSALGQRASHFARQVDIGLVPK
jgi:hypothetical protein